MICNKPCNNKNEFNYCKTTTCIHPEMWSFIISPEKCLENSKLDNLNKGIDELLKKYEEEKHTLTWIKGITAEATAHNIDSNIKKEVYEEVIADLKKLKGE